MKEIPLIVNKGDEFAESNVALSLDAPELTTEQAFILKRMLRLAPQIRNNRQLKQILRKIDAAEREAFYDLLKPYLSFKPLPYATVAFELGIRFSRS